MNFNAHQTVSIKKYILLDRETEYANSDYKIQVLKMITNMLSKETDC